MKNVNSNNKKDFSKEATLVAGLHDSIDPMDYKQQVEKRAHEFYEKRGRLQGHALEDWLEAERILMKSGVGINGG